MAILGGTSSQVLWDVRLRVVKVTRGSLLEWSKAMNIKRIACSINNVENIFLLFAALNNLGGMIDVSAGPPDL